MSQELKKPLLQYNFTLKNIHDNSLQSFSPILFFLFRNFRPEYY